ncbi:MAG: hypothetical protein KKC01_06010 [Gammaproteobacteria bacterium]|nr:hypothetical protein [Gammaproteobacteria bacterium]
MSEQKPWISAAGIGVGALGLLLAVVHFWAGPFTPQPSLERTIAEKVVAIKDATVAALQGEALPDTVPETDGVDADEVVRIAVPVLAALAVILGVIGFAMKEPGRVSIGAVALGGSTFAFQFAGLVLGAIVLTLFIVALLGEIDLPDWS